MIDCEAELQSSKLHFCSGKAFLGLYFYFCFSSKQSQIVKQEYKLVRRKKQKLERLLGSLRDRQDSALLIFSLRALEWESK